MHHADVGDDNAAIGCTARRNEDPALGKRAQSGRCRAARAEGFQGVGPQQQALDACADACGSSRRHDTRADIVAQRPEARRSSAAARVEVPLPGRPASSSARPCKATALPLITSMPRCCMTMRNACQSRKQRRLAVSAPGSALDEDFTSVRDEHARDARYPEPHLSVRRLVADARVSRRVESGGDAELRISTCGAPSPGRSSGRASVEPRTRPKAS